MILLKILIVIVILAENQFTSGNKFFLNYVFSLYSGLLVIFLQLVSFIAKVKFCVPLPQKKNVERIFGLNFSSPSELPDNPGNHCNCHVYPSKRGSNSVVNKFNNFDFKRPLEPIYCDAYSIIGHRGAGLNAPENSLSAIRKCAERNCPMVEFDVCLTKDKIPVLFHDDNLLRVTGVDCRRISEVTWKELRSIDISEGEYPEERVPTLEEAVELCLELGLKFIIDIKDEDDKLIDAILHIFNVYKAYSSGVVSSFYFRVIYKIRSRDPSIVGCMAWRPLYFALPPTLNPSDNWVTVLWKRAMVYIMYSANDFAMKYIFWRILGLSAILVHKDALTLELVSKLRARGLRVFAWTVNCPVEKQFLLNKLQVGYLTDTLDVDNEHCDCGKMCPETWLCNNNR